MHKFINVRPFMEHLFDDPITATKAAEIGQAILAARSLRLTEIAAKMRGSSLRAEPQAEAMPVTNASSGS